MRKIILYIASSIDHFIATEDGGIDWLHSPALTIDGEDYGYSAFLENIDTTLIGHTTYQQVIGFDIDFPYKDKKNYLFTRKTDSSFPDYIFIIGPDPESFIRMLKNSKGKDIWLIGGASINSFLLEKKLIDEIILTRIPIYLEKGIPIFHKKDWEKKFSKETQKTFSNDVVQILYTAI